MLLKKFLIFILSLGSINGSSHLVVREEFKSNLIGTNLVSINYFSSQLPFVDEFKSSQSWITQNQHTWSTKEEHLLDLDSEGWIKSLPFNQAETEYTKVSTLLFREHGNYLPGKYIVLYDGKGSIEYQFDARKNEDLSTPGRDAIEVNPSNAGILLSITSTDPDQTGDYIRNIQVIREVDKSIATTEVFNPQFLAKIQPFGILRFMDWMETNNSKQGEWGNRPKLEDARYSNIGAPIEIMVELANQTDSAPWFTIPHQATDEYVANFTQYVKDNLEPELDIYVEYSNEVWNSDFSQSQWVAMKAQKEWPNSNLDQIDWYSRRTTEINQIWDQVFGKDSERVIGVMGAQAANPAIAKRALGYHWANSTVSHSQMGIDAIAIAPYFGILGKPENQAELTVWTQDPDGGLDKFFKEITQGGVLKNGFPGGALEEAYSRVANHVELAQQEDLQLLAYEGGQHFVGSRGVENNQAITDLFIAANRDRRMETIYQDYLETWFDFGGDLFVHFSDVGVPTKWGSWGALESIYQDGSPKYNGIINFIRRTKS